MIPSTSADSLGLPDIPARDLAESRVYDRGRFSPDVEAAVHHFQSLVKRAFRRRLETHR